MAVGINYSKWDALDVSDSEEDAEPDRASSRAALAQQHRELTEAAAAQQRLRQLISEHASGKPLEPPEEIRDILDEPLWCDEPGSVGGETAGAPHRADALHDQGRAAGHGAAVRESTGQGTCGDTPSSKAAAPAPASAGTLATTRRRDFADWDKLKLEDDDEDRAETKESVETRPPAEVDKLRQLMALQEGLSKMRKDRELRHKKIQQHEQRILERDSRFGSSPAADSTD
jgi:hypothetical protein